MLFFLLVCFKNKRVTTSAFRVNGGLNVFWSVIFCVEDLRFSSLIDYSLQSLKFSVDRNVDYYENLTHKLKESV